MIRIGIDAMGGDFAPEVAIEGAVRALKLIDKESRIVLFGDEKRIVELIKKHGAKVEDFDIVATSGAKSPPIASIPILIIIVLYLSHASKMVRW